MARKIILETTYTFDPTNKVVTIPRVVPRERLLLITNVTSNVVIFNFSDPSLKATNYLTFVSPGTVWADSDTYAKNQVVSYNGYLYYASTAGTSGTVPPTHVSGTIAATGGTASLTFLAVAPNAGVEQTYIVLNYNTTTMASTDKLQFTVDEYEEQFRPAEALLDPVSKFRTSQPQALIDTDFEYGMQPTKWESITMTSNRPFAFFDSTSPLSNVTAITGAGTRTITVATVTPPTVGTPVYISASTAPAANGWFVVDTVSAGTNFTYTASLPVASGSILDATKTYVYTGTFYTGAGITVGTGSGAAFVASTLTLTSASSSGTTVTVASTRGLSVGAQPTMGTGTGVFAANTFVTSILSATQFVVNTTPSTPLSGATITFPYITTTCTTPHGLAAGAGVAIVGSTAATSGPPNGSWIVSECPTPTTFTFIPLTVPSGALTASGGATASVYARTPMTLAHRAYDGGVQFSTGTLAQGSQLVRQTRKYFRYQSGKGIQFSTGTMLKPLFQVDSLTASGTTVTVSTKFPHYMQAGGRVIVSGATPTNYNGVFLVTSVPSSTSFTYTALSAPATSPATGFPISVGPYSWSGACIRLGMFDEQNGMFFEYNGQTLYAVLRQSTNQISGTVAVANGSSTVTGTGTYFSTQVKPGDYITIRGMSYMVSLVTSDTSLQISPEYRGVTVSSGAIVSLRTETRIPQSQWNLDRADGTGPSGLNLNLSKMQMFYIDYSWYGAGAVRFGLKDQKGQVVYVHRIYNSNLQTEAYMRSGNLPSRYEANTMPAYSILTGTLASSDSSLTVADASLFPTSGTVIVTGSTTTSPSEYITYTGKSGNTLTGLGRAAIGGASSAQTFTYSAGAPTGVELASATFNPTVSHWGSSVIMDGRFDDDKQFVFQAGMNTALTNIAASPTTNNAMLSIRLAPSVDSGQIGLLGAREIINRMQLTMSTTDMAVTAGATTAATFLVKLVLNARLSTATGNNWVNVGGSSLAQVMYHASGTTLTGGETIYSFFITATASGVGVSTQDLSKVRDIGTSIVGGGNTLAGSTTANNIYPDGPDVLTISVSNVSSQTTNSVNARISWTEAQA